MVEHEERDKDERARETGTDAAGDWKDRKRLQERALLR
jgi:hypothetical protein